MKLCLLKILLLFATAAIINAEDPFCRYYPPSGGSLYTCYLDINNPMGVDFDRIGGDHIEGFTDADVRSIYIRNQTTLNIPSVICRQFPNLLDLLVDWSGVMTLDNNSVSGCQQLEYFALGFNPITVVPNGVFERNSELQIIYLNYNNIREIGTNAFSGTRAEMIILSQNRLTAYNPHWMAPVNETLRVLVLDHNQITSFPYLPFATLGNLRDLNIGSNPISYLDPFTFLGLSRLEFLAMNEIGLTEINTFWFTGTPNLRTLWLMLNKIREIHPNTFDIVPGLRTLLMSYNELTFIGANSFGSSLSSLQELVVDNNQILAIEEEILNAENLTWMNLVGNRCANRNFYDVRNNQDLVRQELQSCFTNFIGSVSCRFFDMWPYAYECVLYIMNPVGRNDFTEIQREHSVNRTDADVTVLEALSQNTRNVPAVICEQFNNLEDLWIQSSQLEIIEQNSFESCRNLYRIIISYNNIARIPSDIFLNNPALQVLEANVNNIHDVGFGAFTGSSLTKIDLSNNRIPVFNPSTFATVRETLEELYLYTNAITSIPNEAFFGLPNLRELDLGENHLSFIPGNAFRGLQFLQYLTLDSCNLDEINPEWFFDMRALLDFRMNDNYITRIPEGTFNPTPNLYTLSLNGNAIRNLHASSFGSSLNSLTFLLMSGNTISSFDPQIIDQTASRLLWLHLVNNRCISVNFFNVRANPQLVRNQLNECYRMFDGFISCSYAEYFQYACRLSLQNVQGRNDFTHIPGEHLEGRTDNDVNIVDIAVGDSRNIPSIICRQFPNIRQLYISWSFIEVINEATFEDCERMTYISLSFNEIVTIPDFTFINSPLLENMNFLLNRITTIGPNAFAQTQTELLDLARNQLTEFNPQWLESFRENLLFLYIGFNRIRNLPVNSFEGLNNLIVLDMGGNPYIDVPSDVFLSLVSLNELWLDRSELTEIDAQWFRTLGQLQFVSFFDNEITEVPAGIFNNLPNLYEIDLGHNRLTMIHSDSFNTILPNIRYVFADFNQINSIDPRFFDGATDLSYFYLYGNPCVSVNFYLISLDREGVRQQLQQQCFSRFEIPPTFDCLYASFPGYPYSCFLMAFNPSGHDVETITGEHITGQTNENVLSVESVSQSTRNLPSQICRQFPNLINLRIESSGIHVINSESFANCRNLLSIDLRYNRIRSIESGLFNHIGNLSELDFYQNRIATIASGAFNGTQLASLHLGSNRIKTLMPESFIGIGNSLREIFLFENRMINVHANAFENINQITYLDLGLNPGINLPPSVFRGLNQLNVLLVDNSNIQIIHPEWFTDLLRLQELFIHRNNIAWLPESIFAPLPLLRDLTIGGNPLRVLSANSFFGNLANIRRLNVMNAQITAIDADLFRDAVLLETLYLYDNNCADENFYQVSANRSSIEQQLNTCFNNHAGGIHCYFMEIPGYPYTCFLEVNNIAGHNNFIEISGDHAGGNNDASVTAVETLYQNTRNIPSQICQQFTNIEQISIGDSRIEVIDRTGLENCHNLRRLLLPQNNIVIIPDGTFANNPNLVLVDLGMNRISQLTENSFTGAPIQTLDIASNRLSAFDPSWFSTINETLTSLEVYENFITNVNDTAFRNLRNLRLLDIGINPGIHFPSDVFDPLERLETLMIDNCRIRHVNPNWFNRLNSLVELQLHNNNLRNFTVNTFAQLSSLDYISLGRNRIDVLRENAFGNSLRNITRFYAQNNRINEIELAFFDHAESLNLLYLYDNICIDQNFFNVASNRDEVRAALQVCFDNFNVT